MMKIASRIRILTFAAVFGLMLFAIDYTAQAQTTESDVINPLGSQNFGTTIVNDGNTVVVGSTGDTVDGMLRAGRVYIYQRDVDGNLNLFDTLEDPNPSEFGLFGLNLAISGDRLVVGSSGGREDAFIYEKNSIGIWKLVETITGEDTTNFGGCVGVSGDRIIIGANFTDVGNRTRSGKAFIYELDENGDWIETPLTRTRNPRDEEYFGSACDISGDHAIVSAPGWLDLTGYALFFERDISGNWVEVQRAIRRGADRDPFDQFGFDVAIDGNIAVIGVPGAYKDPSDIAGVRGIGSAFIYERDDATAKWRRTELMINEAFGSMYGNSVDIKANKVIVGAPDSVNENGSEGKVYTFERIASRHWDQIKILIPSDTALVSFAREISIFDDLYLSHGMRSTPSTSAVYVFEDVINGIEMLDVDPDPEARLYSFLEAVKATPNSEVVFIRGGSARNFTDDRICPGLETNIRNYREVVTVMSDDEGYAFFNYRFPVGLAGRTHHFQAVDVSTCTSSNLVTEVVGEETIIDGDLVMTPPEQAGASTYEYTVSNATPGGTIAIFRGFETGSDPSIVCHNRHVNIANYITEPDLIADEFGNATGSIFLPGSPGGDITIYFQAIDLSTCRRSKRVDRDF